MIEGIGKSGAGRIEPNRARVGADVAAAKAGDAPGRNRVTVGSLVSEIASAGPPVDGDKVSAIRAAIEAGRYAIDAARIAERMIESDLPAKE